MNPATAHIVVIEDDPVTRTALAGYLTSFGYRVTECAGAEAADQAEALLHLFVVDRVERQVGADAIDEDRVGHVESSGHFTRRTDRRSRPFHAESDPWTAEPAVS